MKAVSADSALINTLTEQLVPSQGDHNEMVKFETPTDPAYLKIRDFIVDILRREKNSTSKLVPEEEQLIGSTLDTAPIKTSYFSPRDLNEYSEDADLVGENIYSTIIVFD